MKKYIIHIISLALLTFFYGCSQEDIQATMKPGNSRTLTLTLTHAGMESRATSSGVKDLNENLIDRVDLFLYPNDGTGSDAVFSKTGITTFTSQEDGRVVINLDVPMSAVEALFPNGVTTCEAYAIVNRPKESAIPTKTDMASLKAIPITSPFDSKVDKEGNAIKQDEFVMDGHSTEITYDNDAISGSIAAERSAAKITLTITGIENTLTDEGGTTWTPLPDQMKVMFYNGVKTSQVNTTSVPADGVYFNLVGEKGRGFTGTNNAAPYNHAIPFYSYPSDWGKQTPDKEAHMVLMLPWIAEGATDQTNFYYEVPIDDINKTLVRNTYYQIKLVVGVLGSTELNDEIVKLTPNCILLNWGEEPINADLDKPKYLVVDEKDVKVYNKNVVRIGYSSSDAINAEITYIRRADYSDAEIDTIRYYQTYTHTTGTSEVTATAANPDMLKLCKVAVEGNNIVLYHDLVNKSSSSGTNYDYLPYYIKVKVTMTSGTTTYTEWIEFTQYPAIYIEAVPNQEDNIKDGKERGYVYVNGESQTDYGGSGDGKWQTVEGTDETSYNPNMYIITTTALDAASNYIIGDSRVTSVNNIVSSGWVSAPALSGESPRTLTYYYPTRTDNENYISPQFRISSAYGQLGNNTLTMEQAKKRCAAYQEDGFPAGRWRLPTSAEFDYIGKLCAEGKIPPIFSSGMDYWSATKMYTYSQNNGGSITETSGSSAFMRCVYDDWYWGSNRINDRTKFTWGDAPRQ